MTDLADILRVYNGSNGEATRGLYRELETRGARGIIALNLFRAAKCAERAKLYRKGPGYKTEAYRRKDWSIKNLAETLVARRATGEAYHSLDYGWGTDRQL